MSRRRWLLPQALQDSQLEQCRSRREQSGMPVYPSGCGTGEEESRRSDYAVHVVVEWFTLVPRPWNQGNDGNRQRRSDMKLLVDFMRLFIEGGYSLDEHKDGYRDEVLKLGKSAEVKLGLYLKEFLIKAKAGGACLKKLRELHCAGLLDAHIQRFDGLFRAGLVEAPSPLSSINQLRPLQLNASI
ncbi:hypothetical protein AaE_012306 [Aphanomyces astaci]|uniref:Uncharacterized protein n=1 Tax=Aphanomyces astaci TaxID=112090 RepID=A0A6A4ZCQ5_APHAT|nr:hypothetical protein AaE_012306 [Aphanomyces astaci]